MAAIHRQISTAERGLMALERFAMRRERFLDAIDWEMMTGDDCFDAQIRDDELDEDIAAAHMEIEHLHRMEILGFRSRYEQVPFDADMPGCMGRPLTH